MKSYVISITIYQGEYNMYDSRVAFVFTSKRKALQQMNVIRESIDDGSWFVNNGPSIYVAEVKGYVGSCRLQTITAKDKDRSQWYMVTSLDEFDTNCGYKL
jgi:hypothetical protein